MIPTRGAEIADFEWNQLRKLEGTIIDQHLMPYVLQELSKEVIDLALSDFLPKELPEPMDEKLIFGHFFLPWFLFNWIPEEGIEIKQFNLKKTISQNYLKTHKGKLSGLEKRFIEEMNKTYYSFYSVLQVEFEKTLLIKDIMLGTTHVIKERQGTHHLKRGDIVFSRILTMDHQSIFVGMAPYVVPASYHHHLIDFRGWLIEENDQEALTPDAMRNELDIDLLDYFFEIMDAIFNKPIPTLVNTDGDLIQFTTSHFRLTISTEDALNRLLPLALSSEPEEFLHRAERTSSGMIKRIELPWLKKGNKKHKEWNNTVMGHLTLEQGKLILETNSEKRTQQGKKLLTKYLGDSIHFQQTLIESPEQKMNSFSTSQEKSLKNEALSMSPEILEQVKAMATSHWKNWFDEPVPALDNKTPREAAKTPEGREKLEALLLQYERHDLNRDKDDPLKADITYLRKELALKE